MHYFFWPRAAQQAALESILLSDLPRILQKHFKARRLNPGEEVCFLNGRGHQIRYVINDNRLTFKSQATTPPASRLRVLLPVLDATPMKTILPALTQIGVRGIIFYESSYSQRRRYHRDKWLETCRLSTTQSGNRWVPNIQPYRAPVGWEELMAFLARNIKAKKINLNIAGQNATDQNLPLTDANLRTFCLVGPEGGFSPRETASLIDLSQAKSFCRHIKLASPILRSETAATLLAGKSLSL